MKNNTLRNFIIGACVGLILAIVIQLVLMTSAQHNPGAGKLGVEVTFPEGWKPAYTINLSIVCEKDGIYRYCTGETH